MSLYWNMHMYTGQCLHFKVYWYLPLWASSARQISRFACFGLLCYCAVRIYVMKQRLWKICQWKYTLIDTFQNEKDTFKVRVDETDKSFKRRFHDSDIYHPKDGPPVKKFRVCSQKQIPKFKSDNICYANAPLQGLLWFPNNPEAAVKAWNLVEL